MSNVSIIIQREFNERVRKKSFIITTILMPVLMIVLMIAPALIMEYSRGSRPTSGPRRRAARLPTASGCSTSEATSSRTPPT